jgi:hypothetical protein
MVGKDFNVDIGTEINLRDLDFDRRIAIERRMDSNRIFLHHRFRIHNNKMGEAAKAILNIFGFTGIAFAFISNLKVAPYLSLAVGIISTLWAFFKMLKMMEDWLIRRAERKEAERNYRRDKKHSA